MKKLFALLAILSAVVSCQKQEESKTIKVGAVFPMTGPIATYGQESVNGAKLALKKLGNIQIKGKTIELILEDNKGEPVESANAVRKLIDINKVHVVFGSVASSNTLAGAPIAQKAKVPLLTPASTNEKVTETGSYISRTCFTDAFQGKVMAKFALETLSKKRAAVIVDNSSDYSKGLSAVFRKEFANGGGALVTTDDFSYVQKDTDFRSLLRKVQGTNPDVIFLPGYYTEVGLILKQARDMGITAPFLGGDGWDSPKLQELAGPKGIKNNYISSHFSPDDKDPMVQQFVSEYQSTYGQKPGAMAALGYDGILTLVDVFKRAKSLKHADIQDAINSVKGFIGVTGAITIDENRNAKKSAVVLETTSGGNIFNSKVNP